MATEKRILFCHCAYSQIVPAGTKAAVLAALRAAGVDFRAAADLCELAAKRDPALRELAGDSELAVVACYPRAVKWLFAAAGAPLTDGKAEILNMRVSPPGQIVRLLLGEDADALAEAAAPADEGEGPSKGEWIPWFPVIDRDRCKDCKQCLNFCLFGVYAISSDGRVEVSNPANCKTNCPACARLCPEVAIIFPKHSSSPINGDVVRPAHASKAKAQADIAARAGEDLHAVLRSRGFAAGSDNAPGGSEGN